MCIQFQDEVIDQEKGILREVVYHRMVQSVVHGNGRQSSQWFMIMAGWSTQRFLTVA